MHASHDDRSNAPARGLGWLVGSAIAIGSVGVTIATVLGTPLGGHGAPPYLPFARGIARDRPGEPDEAPPHPRDLPRQASVMAAEAPGPARIESFPHVP